MFIIKGKGRKTDHVWSHIKQRHTGDKVCVVGFTNKLPENYLRNKQIIFYEALNNQNWLSQAKKFIEKFQDQFDGIIFYVDCSEEDAKILSQDIHNLKTRITVTVNEDIPEIYTEQILISHSV